MDITQIKKRFIPYSIHKGKIIKNTFTDEELITWCNEDNSVKGDLNYFDCEKCLNRGYISYIDYKNKRNYTYSNILCVFRRQ